MLRALNSAASGMTAQELKIDLIANNLANVNTNGYKKSRGEFQDLLYETIRAPGARRENGEEAPVGLQVGQGVRPVATLREFSMGSLKQTGNSLDLAIEGDGFFQVLRPEGGTPLYTRDGAFKTDNEGRVVTSEGLLLDPPLIIPEQTTQIMIAQDGTVTALVNGDEEPVAVGSVELTRFINPAGLNALGRNLYGRSVAAGEPQFARPGTDGLGALSQGFLEGSNVKVVEEMIALISTQRAYETNSRVIQAADEMLRSTTNLR